MRFLYTIILAGAILNASAQIVGSGKASIKINNKNSESDRKVDQTENNNSSAIGIELINLQVKPSEVVTWQDKKINLVGKLQASNNTAFFCNDVFTEINSSGYFNLDLDLNPGINNISLKAVSGSQTKELSFKVDYRPKNNQAVQELKGKYYALVIGISKYNDPQINELDKPVNDAESFYNVLTSKYSFDKENVKLLKNATISELIDALDLFAKLVKPDDNFLIFYAGHGVWDANSEIGFWLPSDAQKNSKLAWFRNSTLRDYLREIKSKHTLLITDACFGGSIFKTRKAFNDAPKAVSKLYELPSRKAMTSGTLTEVPDQSAFLKYLVERLKENNEKYLSSEQLFSSFRIAVINNSNAIPQFGEIKDVGDEGGDFIFQLRQ